MTTVTELCNIALARIGNRNGLVDFATDTTTEGDMCRIHYPMVRRSILRAHPWNCAVKRAMLTRLAEPPAFEYQYQFLLPDDYLAVVRMSWEADGYISADRPASGYWEQATIAYRIEASTANAGRRVLLTNQSSCGMEYIADITDSAAFDPMLVNAISMQLAVELAMSLAQNRQMAEMLTQLAQMKLREARSADSQEGAPRTPIDDGYWARVRL